MNGASANTSYSRVKSGEGIYKIGHKPTRFGKLEPMSLLSFQITISPAEFVFHLPEDLLLHLA